MKCLDVRDKMILYIKDKLSDPEMRGIEAHLERCPACREVFALEEEIAAQLNGDELIFTVLMPDLNMIMEEDGKSEAEMGIWEWILSYPLQASIIASVFLCISIYHSFQTGIIRFDLSNLLGLINHLL